MKHRPSRTYLQALQERYARASKKAKGVILAEFTQTTQYTRDHAIRLLSHQYAFLLSSCWLIGSHLPWR